MKYAVIGTSCSGKTTLVYNVVGQLRKEGYHIEGVVSGDRSYTFNPELLDTSNIAQSYVILQQAFLETKYSVRTDVNIILSDRSLIDFFAYYSYYIADKDIYYDIMNHLAFEWCKTYDCIFYVSPLPWVDDTKRPPDSERMAVDFILQSYIGTISNIVRVPDNNREEFVINKIKDDEKKTIHN